MMKLQSYKEFESTISQMENIYSTAKICDYKNKTKCDLALEPEITEILMHSRDPEELKHIWVEWRKASGEQVKSLYPKYVELANIAARLNNFSDYAEYWMKDYEVEDFPAQIGKICTILYLCLRRITRKTKLESSQKLSGNN